jgi:protein-L-isoaspartate O-methyltransferase
VTASVPHAFDEWVTQLEARHLADLRVPEVTRALRALSSAYVERRHKVSAGATLDSAGKRAAFALFYAPLHFLATLHVVQALAATDGSIRSILDLGCGTGAAGAAWAVASGGSPSVLGIDRHPWAVDEARWTYRQLHVNGHARQGDLARTAMTSRGSAVVEAAAAGTRVLVLEPIARAVTPWWDATSKRITTAGGRADEWRIPVELPSILKLLDRAAGLDHRELKLRSLYIPAGVRRERASRGPEAAGPR